MRATRTICWLATFAALASTPSAAWEAGENFVTPPLPDATKWTVTHDPNRPAARLWKNEQNDEDSYRIDVIQESGDTLATVRMTLDAPGKANCTSFDTTTIRESPVHGYPRLLWRTDCVRGDDARSTLLNLAVRGRDGLYLAIKSWRFAVAESEVDDWTRRFERAFVCDTRKPDRPCPDGVEGVD